MSAVEIDETGEQVVAALEAEIAELRQQLELVTASLEEAELTIDKLFGTDPLTGALNRNGLDRVLAVELRNLRTHHAELSAVLINLDQFKKLNDRLGHRAADVVLKEVTRRIRTELRASDYLARIGPDEFLILFTGTKFVEAVVAAERVRAGISASAIEITGKQIDISASLGVASVSEEALSTDEILASAEQALVRSREADASQRAKLEQRRGGAVRRIEAGPVTTLLGELASGESLRVFAQAIYRLSDEHVEGYELLSRGPAGTVYESPVEFLRLAAERDALVAVDRACFLRCVEVAVAYPGKGKFHINLLPSTLLGLDPALVLEHIPPARRDSICLEINEQQIIGEPSYLVDVVHELRAAGLRIGIDDVGFGRSCLENLIVLEPEFVKIDRKFVLNVSKRTRRTAELRRLLNVAKTLGAAVVAEGVENRDDLESLLALEVPSAQGWLWGKPVPAAELLGAAGT